MELTTDPTDPTRPTRATDPTDPADPTDPTPAMVDISLAQWSLVEEWRAGKWTTLDFPRLAREDFGLNGVEFVNTLFEVPTAGYLQQLKRNADTHGVALVLIMVDDEGDGCSPTRQGRKEFELFHRKWVDIAYWLGCRAIRTNCRGPLEAGRRAVAPPDANSHTANPSGTDPHQTAPRDALQWAAESYRMLLEYARPSGVKILIENHGGLSNDADWMVRLMKEVDDPLFGTYPDWREPAPDFDNLAYLEKTLPFAGGMSYRNQPTEELTVKMIELCKNSGFQGWYGIESDGREAINAGIGLLKKHLFPAP
ncbi:MAG TPA: TIM barrel protein [Puia sp.]|nr:TIM barrel protein [Puia sp.]